MLNLELSNKGITDEAAGGGFESRLEKQLTDLGLILPGRPAGTLPDAPIDMTTMTTMQVSRYLTEFTAWHSYAKPQAAKAAAAASIAKSELRIAKLLGRPIIEIIELDRLAVEKAAFSDVMKALVMTIKGRRDTVSREITRLGLDEPDARRRPSSDDGTVFPRS